MLLLIKFKIEGNLRFLSHAETIKVFQRACLRADIKLRYSQGFNPRPKLSLPLPRPVGVEADDELLCLRLQARRQTGNHSTAHKTSFDTERFKTRLSAQLPEGLELLSVTVAGTKTSFYPGAATYVLAVRQDCCDEKLKAGIEHLLDSESLILRRPINIKNYRLKNIDVRPFVKSIRVDNVPEELSRGNSERALCIFVECKISPAGSIRVEEILNLLKLDVQKLAAPIKRTNVQWQ